MDIKIDPDYLSGTVKAVDSKSYAHRLLIASALAGTCFVEIEDMSEDLLATQNCLRELSSETPVLNCAESGSTLRFLLPLAVLVRGGASFVGSKRLAERPLKPFDSELLRHGCIISKCHPDEILHISGTLSGGVWRLPGDVSSQFVTALLMCLPLLEESSDIVITSPLESKPYVDITLDVLKMFGISVLHLDNVFRIAGGQKYMSPATVLHPEGDWSSAAFWMAANALGSDIEVTGLNPSSVQGDRKIFDLVKDLKKAGERPSVRTIHAEDIPDLVPITSVLAALTPGKTQIRGAGRLRLKESDRIETTCAMLKNLGAEARASGDGLDIVGQTSLPGGEVDGAGDHRIVMAAAIAATRCESPVTIRGAEAHNKSYPRFFEDYKKLGGKFYEI